MSLGSLVWQAQEQRGARPRQRAPRDARRVPKAVQLPSYDTLTGILEEHRLPPGPPFGTGATNTRTLVFRPLNNADRGTPLDHSVYYIPAELVNTAQQQYQGMARSRSKSPQRRTGSPATGTSNSRNVSPSRIATSSSRSASPRPARSNLVTAGFTVNRSGKTVTYSMITLELA